MTNWDKINVGTNSNSWEVTSSLASDFSRVNVNCDADHFKIDNMSVSDFIDKKIKEVSNKKTEVDVNTKTMLDASNEKIIVKHYKDGYFVSKRNVMSDIKDIQVYNNVVIMTFADGTTTKAVLDAEDEFNLENGISICITKKLLGNDGDSVYNKIIKRAFNVMKHKEEAAAAEYEKKMREKCRKEAALKRHNKKMLKKREEVIEIQKEAYLRAITCLIGTDSDEQSFGA